jgi:hypothetical protein
MKKGKQETALAAPGTGGAIVKWDDELAKFAEQASAKEVIVGGKFIGLKAGQMTINGAAVKGNSVNVVVLADVHENTYYPDAFDANSIVPPACYAFGEDEKTMAPHPEAEHPQAKACHECKWNEYGTSPRGSGKGKACQNRRRLALMPAGSADTAENVAKAEVVYLKVPVTSTRAWSAYVKGVALNMKRPPFALVTKVTSAPDPKVQVTVSFEPVDPLENEVLGAVLARVKEQKEAIVFPYAKAKEETEEVAPKKTPKKKF